MMMFSCYVVTDSFATPWTVAHHAPLYIGSSRQEHWSGLPCPPPGDLPDPGIESVSLRSPELAGRFFTTSTTWKAMTQAAIIPRNGLKEMATDQPWN